MSCLWGSLLLLYLLCLVTVTRPCSVIDWTPMTLSEQAGEARTIVYGTVVAHYPLPDEPHANIFQAYVAEMDVHCTLKGDDLPARINISEAGQLTSCHHTAMPVGETLITFLKEVGGELLPDEVNHLSVAFQPDWANFEEVEQGVRGSLCACAERTNGTDNELDWDGLYDDEGRCGGGAVRSASLAAVVAVALATAIVSLAEPVIHM